MNLQLTGRNVWASEIIKGEKMKSGVFKLYLLIVCFVALMCAAITLGKGLYEVVSLVAPKLTINNYIYNKHKSLDSFRQSQSFPGRPHPQALMAAASAGMPMPFVGVQPVLTLQNNGQKEQAVISDSALEIQRLKSFNAALSDHRRGALQAIIRVGIIFIISLSLFLVHWRIAKKTDSNEDQALQ